VVDLSEIKCQNETEKEIENTNRNTEEEDAKEAYFKENPVIEEVQKEQVPQLHEYYQFTTQLIQYQIGFAPRFHVFC
jgi:hypothetical protein